MLNCLVVGVGGFLGAVLRYLLCLLPLKAGNGFPFATLAVNILGAFLIGFITAESVKLGGGNEKTLLFLRTGLCGGFTTFSTFSLEVSELFRGGSPLVGIAYIAASVLGCLAAIAIAQSLVGD